ncbi:MAG: RNA polymerase sigma factor [Candidatus Omnitrophica bacterium]|nr:RNA polymerase sigma factor [Candidatus Omnitrophota bacterium]
MPHHINMRDIDSDILKRAAGGDIEAFEDIYRSFSGFVYNVALGITRDRSDAEEVTQDVFIKAYRGLRGFRFGSSLKTWIYRIAANEALNRYNKSKKEQSRRLNYDDNIEAEPAAGSGREEIMQSDSEKRFAALLEKLDQNQRACLVLREIEGLSYKDIADVLRIPVNTVRSRLKRARQALLEKARKELGKDGLREYTGIA